MRARLAALVVAAGTALNGTALPGPGAATLLGALLVAPEPLPAAERPPAADSLKLNPFNDPFVAATQGGRACPAPLGPAYTDAQMRGQAHHRAERGTTCWLEGRCAEPNAYRADPRIAQAVVAALLGEPALKDTRIWVTVERAFVTLEGCVGSAREAELAESIVKSVADVRLVLPFLTLPGERPRYRVAPSR